LFEAQYRSYRGRGRERSVPLPDFSRKIGETSARRVHVDHSSYHTTLLGVRGVERPSQEGKKGSQ